MENFEALKLLYSSASPFARRVRVLLAEMGLAYESDLFEGMRPVDNIAPHSPTLQVPVLYAGSQVVFGSLLIQEFLFQLPRASRTDAGEPLAPHFVRTGADYLGDRQVLVALDSISDAYLLLRNLAGREPKVADLVDRSRQRILTTLTWLDVRLGAGSGFWPGYLSVMDINLVCLLLHAELRGVVLFREMALPALTRLVETVEKRQSFQITPILPG